VVVLATARSSNQAKPSATWRSIYSSEGLAPSAVLCTAEQSRAPGRRRSLSHSHLAQLSKSHDQIKSKLTATAAVVWTATDCFGLVVGGSAAAIGPYAPLHQDDRGSKSGGGGSKSDSNRDSNSNLCEEKQCLRSCSNSWERMKSQKDYFPLSSPLSQRIRVRRPDAFRLYY
jgi:hypothetical protein